MNFDLRFYWALLLRRLPVMMLFVLVAAGLGVVTALKLPDTYTTSARLLVEAPQIPERMVASTVQTNAVEQLDIIQQRLMTRANMIDIANRFNALENIRQMEPGRVVTDMEAATRIRRSAGRDQATLLTISFTARDPQIAAGVVNEYVTLILQDSTATRTEQVTRTLQFFEQEVQRLSDDLDNQSAAITRFKAENADALPEEQGYRLGRQALLQERLGRIERDISAAEAQQREIVNIFENTGQVRAAPAQARRTPEETQLAAAQSELELALATYSDTNPRVVQLRAQIARLEAVVAAQTASGALSDADAAEPVSPQEALFNATLTEIETRLVTLRAEETATRTELEGLQQAIARSAANGIQLSSLERDYDSIQGRYNAALNNLNQARMSERIESTAQGQRISVIEYANVPQAAAGPNRPRIAILGLAVGLVAAAGYFMLLEILNRTVRRPAELTGRFNIIPLATIPYMESRGHRFARRTGMIVAMLAVMTGVPLGLWYIDTYYQPLELLVQKVLDRVSLG
ncbi:chain length-determining protein [Yoonia sp.]|uniref:GumC family protein n=1 Tax=Yoonia sp. TaxID=2212373 RepID=UPI0019EA0E0B|nr:chain length-determining protein [Yoonia sp.]MBE0414347.1 chain length-determining protein [Yoonia sp.]